MKRLRDRGETIRRFVLENVEAHPRDITGFTARKFGISRQAAYKHIANLRNEGALVSEGRTRKKIHRLAPLLDWDTTFDIQPGLAEDRVLAEHIEPRLGSLPENVLRLWEYGFTEMFNNAIDHSQGSTISISLRKYPASTEIWVMDDGVGIFKKIQQALGLMDERQAVLELAKGKLTTDPSRHSGEGIFFSSRSFDHFVITSGATYFTHEAGEEEDWILENERGLTGTNVFMKLSNHTSRVLKNVFDEFSTDDNYGFNKTVVPVKLARLGTENLISRSQAKRLLSRVDKFETVLFDFRDVDTIGQAFADEIFRVFAAQHPGMKLYPINANDEVSQMILRARHANPDGPQGQGEPG